MEAIRVQFPLSFQDISSMTEFGGNLWVGTFHGKIQILTPNPDSISNPFFLSDKTPFSEENTHIHTMFTIEPLSKVFAFIKKDEIGKIITIDDKYKIETFAEGVTLASCSPKGCLPAFVLAKNNLFYYYSIKDKFLQSPIEVDGLANIKNIAVNNAGVAFYANSMYYLWYKISKRTTNVAACVLPHSCIAADKNSFVFCMKEMITISGEDGQKMHPPIAINKSILEGTEPPHLGCFFGGKCHLFYLTNTISAKITYSHNDNFVPRKIPKVVAYSTYGDILYLVSEMGIFMTGGMTDGMKLATMTSKNGIKAALDVAKTLDSKRLENAMVDFFRTLWEMKLFKEAMILLSEILWTEDVKEVLSLFPFFVLDAKPQPRNKLNGLIEYTLDDITVFEKLGQFLELTKKMFSESHESKLTHQIPVLETALFEYYAVFHQTRDLNQLMAQENSVNQQSVTLFFNQQLAKRSLHPALAIYFAFTERMEESLQIWKTLNDADKNSSKWALEAAYTLQNTDDDDFIKSNLKWIKQRSQYSSVVAFLHQNVDVSFAISWIKENANEYMVNFTDYLVKENLLKKENAKLALDCYCKLQSIAGAPEFTADHAAFFEKYYSQWQTRTARAEELDELDIYICKQIKKVAETFPDIDLSKYCKHAKTYGKFDLMFTLFDISGNYSDAAKEFVTTWKVDFNKITNFCRKSRNPEKAFKVTIELLIDEGYNMFTQCRNFIMDNIEYINEEDLLSWIPDNANLDDFMDILICMEGKSILRHNIIEMQMASIKQIENEVDYKLTCQEFRHSDIGYTTVCESCKRPVGGGFVSISPQNTVYHLACKPQKPEKVETQP